MKETQELWRTYNLIAKLLKNKLNRTSNIVGEYAEYLIAEYTSGELLIASSKSADIKAHNGDLYQVKSRKTSKNIGSLGVIRTWGFDFLAVIIFDEYGSIEKAIICPQIVAQEYGKRNDLQNGWIITVTKVFLTDERNTDITFALRKINAETIKVPRETASSTLQSIVLPIGVFVREELAGLVENDLIDQGELEKLQKADYSKAVLGIQYPLLKKVHLSDLGKIQRYWKTPIAILGEKYYICSEWYETKANNDRPFFEKWLKEIKKNLR